jgi:hypothetical protein
MLTLSGSNKEPKLQLTSDPCAVYLRDTLEQNTHGSRARLAACKRVMEVEKFRAVMRQDTQNFNALSLMTSIILEDNFVAVKGVMKLRANLLFA